MTQDQIPPQQPAPQQQQTPACPACSGGSNTFKILIIAVCLIAAGIITYNNFLKPQPTYLPPPDELPTRQPMADEPMEQAPASMTEQAQEAAGQVEQAAEKTIEQVQETAEQAGQAVEAAAEKGAEKVEEATAPSNP
ncbi:MAG: hypothetical protein IT445_15620 [Phycisphaeraceae bacterium]|nr:hypothetical protein [Phycisphaeraceae bacterium]